MVTPTRIPDPSIGILLVEFGHYPEILALNPSLRPGARAIKLVLRIDWQPLDGARVVEAFQRALLDLSPDFRRHRCRGPREYHVFQAGRGAMDARQEGADERGD